MKKKPSKLLKLHNVSKHYQMGDNIIKALNKVSLEICKICFIVGSGKNVKAITEGALTTLTPVSAYLSSPSL